MDSSTTSTTTPIMLTSQEVMTAINQLAHQQNVAHETICKQLSNCLAFMASNYLDTSCNVGKRKDNHQWLKNAVNILLEAIEDKLNKALAQNKGEHHKLIDKVEEWLMRQSTSSEHVISEWPVALQTNIKHRRREHFIATYGKYKPALDSSIRLSSEKLQCMRESLARAEKWHASLEASSRNLKAIAETENVQTSCDGWHKVESLAKQYENDAKYHYY